ncbi:MAG: PAS domain S-box protein [Ferruginibacter sp.]|nr:PAS domain S-box protein [Ferruginibacter sp.]
MQKKNTKGKIRFNFIAAILCICFFVLITYRNMLLTESESSYIKSSLEVLLKLEDILTDVQDIETGQRGFVISGDTHFLDPYFSGLIKLKRDTTILNTLTLNDPSTKEEHDALLKLVGEKAQFSKFVVEARKVYGYDSAASYIKKEHGLVLMNEIRQKVATLENKDRDLFRKSNLKREQLSQKRSWQLFSLAIIFFIILFINYRVIITDYDLQQKSERLLKYNASLIGNISDAVITTDKDYKISNWNIHAQEMYGYNEEEVLGRTVGEVFRINYEDNTQPDLLKEYTMNDNWKGEVIHYNKSNQPLNVDVAVSSIKDVEGNNVGTVSVIRNVTERNKIERQLKQLTTNLEEEVKIKVAELNAVFERITDAFIALDNDWRYVYVNNKAAEMHNWDGKDLIGKIIWDVNPDVVDEPFYDALQEAKRSRQSQRLELYYSKNDKWFEDLIYPSADGMSVYYHDITEKKKAEQRLLASEQELKISNERFMLVAKATNDAVWDWDMATDVIWGNESFCNIFDIDINQKITFEEFTSRLHNEDKNAVLSNFEMALKNKTTYIIEEFRFKNKAGVYLTLYDRAYVMYNSEGRAYRMLGAMQDITEQKNAQYQLVLEKELSDSIINSLPGVFYLYNQEGKFYRWNRNFEQVTGYSADEISKLHPLDLFVEDQKELLRNKIANVFKNGEDNIEANFRLKDGSTIPYYLNGMVINYEGENCLMGVGIDISEKVQSQQELQESEAKYRTLIEQASDGIFISNQQGDYLDVNTSATMLTGYEKDELLKLNIRDILFENGITTEKPNNMLAEVLKGQVVINERMMRQKNGNIINVEISSKLLPDGRFQGIIRDITARKKTEEEMRMSEHKYRLLFNQNPMPMSMISLPQRNFLDVNDAAIEFYGYTKKEFLEMNIKDLRPEEEIINLPDISTYKAGINNTGIWRHRKKDGTIVKVNIITHDIINEGKHAKLLLANDITEKIMAEEKLKKSHEDLRQLATHLQDIREDERTRIAREIHDELGQQLTGLKMDISWLSKKISNGSVEINQKMTEALKLIDETVKTVRRIATQLRPSILDDLGLISAMEWQSEEFEKRFKIKTSFVSNSATVQVESEIATGLFRIYQESLTNVLRHSKATQVKATLNASHELLILHIADNGIGFNAIENESKKTLGLLGMKERTLIMGGTYEITSKPGNGTTVVITVPVNN